MLVQLRNYILNVFPFQFSMKTVKPVNDLDTNKCQPLRIPFHLPYFLSFPTLLLIRSPESRYTWLSLRLAKPVTHLETTKQTLTATWVQRHSFLSYPLFCLTFSSLPRLPLPSWLNPSTVGPGNHLATDKYPRGICGASEVSKASEWKPSSVPSHPPRVV